MTPTRVPWRGFPDVVTHTTISKMKSLPDYPAAKTGDFAAALRLARVLLKPAKFDAFPAAVDFIVPVQQLDRGQRNAIPLGMAFALQEHLPDTKVHLDIYQANQVHHTGANAPTRLPQQPVFAGALPRAGGPGARYLIVDDVTTYGSSLANLRGHVEALGERVVVASTLAASLFSTRLAPDEKMVGRISQRHAPVADLFQSRTGFGFDRLTNKEAYYLDGIRVADALRSLLDAERERPADSDRPGRGSLCADRGRPAAHGWRGDGHER